MKLKPLTDKMVVKAQKSEKNQARYCFNGLPIFKPKLSIHQNFIGIALENAVSIALTILTTERFIADIPEEMLATPAMNLGMSGMY